MFEKFINNTSFSGVRMPTRDEGDSDGAIRLPKTNAERSEVQASPAHGFTMSTLDYNGTPLIKVNITRAPGKEVACLLSGSDIPIGVLDEFGMNALNGATLLSEQDLRAVVESLCKAITGMQVVDGVLQTDDAVLKKVFAAATKGVRTTRTRGEHTTLGRMRYRFSVDDEGKLTGKASGIGGYGFGDMEGTDCVALFGEVFDLSHPELLNFPSLIGEIPEHKIIDVLSLLFLDEGICRNREVFLNALLEVAGENKMELEFTRASAEDFKAELDALQAHGVRQSVEQGIVPIERFCELAQQPNLLLAAHEAVNYIP